MPRYFFDVHNGDDVPDADGIELADLTEARREAMRAAGDMLRDAADMWRGGQWTMIVRDEDDGIVATVTISAR